MRSPTSFLSARILELQDVERRKIARELHDSVGQGITGLKLNLGQLQAAKSPESSDDPALLSETIDLTDRAIGKVRTISALTPPSSALMSLAWIPLLVGMSRDSQNEAASKSEFTREKSLSGFRAKSNSLYFPSFKKP